MPTNRRKRQDEGKPEIPLPELTYLNDNHIYWRGSKSKRAFSCQVCGLSFPSIGASLNHSYKQSHGSNLVTHEIRHLLIHLPPICEAHRQVLNESLREALGELRMDVEEITRRKLFAERLMSVLKAHLKNLQITGVGALWNSLAFKSDQVHLNVGHLDLPNGSPSKDKVSKVHQKCMTLVVSDDSAQRLPGLGYLLGSVYEVLKANVVNAVTSTPNKSEVTATVPATESLSDFPVYGDLYRVVDDNFCIVLVDSCGVKYRLSTGSERGHHLAHLIQTYLNLDQRAWDLAYLFRRLIKLGNMDLPGRGTFPDPILPLMVIFYLQHTEPPVLPNLHHIYRCHREELPPEAVCHVFYEDDYSYVTDPQSIAKYFPAPDGDNSHFDLADLWLGLLRFYLVEFQKSAFAVCVAAAEPVYWKQGRNGMDSIAILDPFDPCENLCRKMTSSGFSYITAQLMSAYGYFGVPRLSHGRHVFTKILTADPPEVLKSQLNTSTEDATNGGFPGRVPFSRRIHLTPVIDEADGFQGNLVKLRSLLAERFSTVCQAQEEKLREGNPCRELPHKVESTSLQSMVAHIIHVTLDEVLEPGDILIVTQKCMAGKTERLFGQLSPNDLILNQSQYQSFVPMFSKMFWAYLCHRYIDRGLFAVKLGDFCKALTFTFRRALSEWYEMVRMVDKTSPTVKSPKVSKPNLDSEPQSSASEPQSKADGRLSDSDDLTEEIELELNGTVGQVVVGDSVNEFSMDDQCEFAERTLDLGEDLETETEQAVVDSTVPTSIEVAEPAEQQPPSSTTKSKKSGKAKAECVNVTWNDVISRDLASEPVDHNYPYYYRSKVVNSLKPEELACPFTNSPNLPPPGRFGLRTSTLGLLDATQPSTLFAHWNPPEPQCRACGQLGHETTECRVSVDQTVSFHSWKELRNTVPERASQQQLSDLTDCLNKLASFHDCSGQEPWKRYIVDTLKRMFSARFSSVQLELFGSTANGFELPSSDMDLCVFFPENSPRWNDLKTHEGTMKLIRQFKNYLYQRKNEIAVVHIHAILNAKVPILKVRFMNGYEVDISFSNYLAMNNTRMLRTYTMLTPVLRVLGIALKIIGKLCHIGNASIGGVSSYALIIMLIHYLQQIDHLPILQQLYETSEKPNHIVGGWDAWFQEDLSVVHRLWKPPAEPLSLAELWLGFFRYYLFEFDRDVNVVCIRQKALLPRFVKMWDSLFAVEDPFNLDHNLTGGLPRDSLICILDVFHAVLKHHTTFIRKEMPLGEWQFSLFAPAVLSRYRSHGAPPKSRCFNCQQFGHRASDCPMKNKYEPNATFPSGDDNIDLLIGPFRRTSHLLPLPKAPPLTVPQLPVPNRPPVSFMPALHRVPVVPQIPQHFVQVVNPPMTHNPQVPFTQRSQPHRIHRPNYRQNHPPQPVRPPQKHVYFNYTRPLSAAPQQRALLPQPQPVAPPQWVDDPSAFQQHFPPPSPGKPVESKQFDPAVIGNGSHKVSPKRRSNEHRPSNTQPNTVEPSRSKANNNSQGRGRTKRKGTFTRSSKGPRDLGESDLAGRMQKMNTTDGGV